MIDLDELERLEKVATPGGWVVVPDCDGDLWVTCIGGKDIGRVDLTSDADLIVAVRNALRELIERVRKAEARVAELEAERKGKALVGVGQLREIEGTGTAADSYREEAGCPVCGARTPSEYDEEGNERGPQPIPHRQTCWLAHAIMEAGE